MKEKEADLRSKWESEKEAKTEINKKKEELEQAKFALAQAENNYDLEKSAMLRHGKIPALEQELKKLQEENKSNILSDVVDEESIAKCGHTTVKTLDVPKEIVNLTKKEIEEKYTGWEVKDFSKEQFTLYRVIEANCDDHFVLKENDGYITVYNELTDEISNLIEKTDIQVESLREEDQNDLQEGIKIYGKSELSSLIEDFSS